MEKTGRRGWRAVPFNREGGGEEAWVRGLGKVGTGETDRE